MQIPQNKEIQSTLNDLNQIDAIKTKPKRVVAVKYLEGNPSTLERDVNDFIRDGWVVGQFTSERGPYGTCVIQQMLRYN